MATRTGTVTAVINLRGPDSMVGGEADVSTYAVYVDNLSGSSVIGGTDTLRVSSLVTAISDSVRDGKTRTVVGGAVAPWQHGVGSGGVALGFTTSLSTAQLDITPKLASDWTTDATLPSGSMLQPFAVVVTVREV
jgi:hypothetical protein